MKKAILLFGMVFFSCNCLYPMPLDEATFLVGKRLFSKELYMEALPRFLDVVRKYPDSNLYRESLFYLGQTYGHLGKYKSSLQYYKVLLKKSRTTKERQAALLGIAKSWLQLGAHNKAAEFYSFFVSEYPESEYAAAALYFAGISRERENKNAAAIEKYKAILELYPNSDYYTKAIEKLAILGNETPEYLWVNDCQQTPKSYQKYDKIDLFLDDGVNINESRCFEDILDIDIDIVEENVPGSKEKRFSSDISCATAVSTSLLSNQIEESSKKECCLETSQLENNRGLPDDMQKLVDCSAVQLLNNEFKPVENASQISKKKELESYKKIWEQEYQEKMLQNQLDQNATSVKEMLDLSEHKAQILNVKEESLKEQQNKIQNTIYQDFKSLEEKPSQQCVDFNPSQIVNDLNHINEPEEVASVVLDEYPDNASNLDLDIVKSQEENHTYSFHLDGGGYEIESNFENTYGEE